MIEIPEIVLDGNIPGELIIGIDGRGIASIERISGNGAAGSLDTYRINYTDKTSSTFTVRNGANGQDGGTFIPAVDGNGNLSWSNDKGMQNPGSVNIKGPAGNSGRGIVSIRRTSGTGTSGSTDVYTITYTDNTTSTFTVYNGRNGGKGGDGATFTPFVDEDGNLSWSNNNGLANPGTVNIKGDQGDSGVSGVWVGSEAPTDGDYNVWVDPDGTADLPGGESGEDGFSPIAKVEQTAGGAVISITDKDGTTTATISNGKDGEDGKDGVVSVAGAKVGQTVTIAAVDDNGVPTAWEAVDFPSEGEYELIETIVCDGTFNTFRKTNLSLKRAKIFLNMKAGSTAISGGVEGYNDAGLFGYAWLGSLINTGERFANVLLVSDGKNAYMEYVAPATAAVNSAAVNRTSYHQNADTPIKGIIIYASGSGALIPAGSTIEIWGVRA